MVRVDLNVPMDGARVSDTTRIERIAPTINEIAEGGGKVILLAHFGRPKGVRVSEMSLAAITSTLASILGHRVAFSTDCIGPMAEAAVSQMKPGEILLMENTRFHAGEEANNPEFARALAENGDIFVSDAFSASHRAHASTVGVTEHLESVAGRTMQAELEALSAGLGAPSHPLVAVVGGAKVSTKLELLGNLVSKVDALAIGGGMANTFLAAQGKNVGKSLCEHELAGIAQEIMEKAEQSGCSIILPVDAVIAEEFKANAATMIVSVDDVPENHMILDAGPKTVEIISDWIGKAKTLVWNGPLGAFEIPPFDTATVAAAKVAAERTMGGHLVSVAGGGDTVAALNHAGVTDQFTYVSTAGGAFLEWMEGKELPGVGVLKH